MESFVTFLRGKNDLKILFQMIFAVEKYAKLICQAVYFDSLLQVTC